MPPYPNIGNAQSMRCPTGLPLAERGQTPRCHLRIHAMVHSFHLHSRAWSFGISQIARHRCIHPTTVQVSPCMKPDAHRCKVVGKMSSFDVTTHLDAWDV